MLVERIEHKWLLAFERALAQCQVQPGEVAVVLSETQSRPVNVQLARLALERLGARVFDLTLTTPALTAPAPVRSTGASDAIAGLAPVVASLQRVGLVVDCTVEGLLHAPELPQILQGATGIARACSWSRTSTPRSWSAPCPTRPWSRWCAVP